MLAERSNLSFYCTWASTLDIEEPLLKILCLAKVQHLNFSLFANSGY